VIVASSAAANREVLQEGRLGYLYSLGDSQALARVILDCLLDPGAGQTKALRTRRQVRRFHQVDDQVKCLMQLYRWRQSPVRTGGVSLPWPRELLWSA